MHIIKFWHHWTVKVKEPDEFTAAYICGQYKLKTDIAVVYVH